MVNVQHFRYRLYLPRRLAGNFLTEYPFDFELRGLFCYLVLGNTKTPPAKARGADIEYVIEIRSLTLIGMLPYCDL